MMMLKFFALQTLVVGVASFVTKPLPFFHSSSASSAFTSLHVSTSLERNSGLSMMSSSNATDTSPGTVPLTGSDSVPSVSVSTKGTIRLKGSTRKSAMPSIDHSGPVIPIYSTEKFIHVLENAPEDSLVVVKYHANFCKVCARVILKYKKMADVLSKSPTPKPLTFMDVEVTANPQICNTLEIKKFPFLQIYRNMECVASFGTGPAHNFQKVVGDTLDAKLNMTDEDWRQFRHEFKNEIAEQLNKLEVLKISSVLEEENHQADHDSSNVSP